MTAEQQIDSYLAALRIQLSPVTIEDREEIVREICAHIRDSAEQSGASVDTILAQLGDPADLAAQYRDGLLICRASRSFSPVRLIRGALRLATKGIFGVIVLFCGIFGYAIGGGMVLSGMLKSILPANTGLWIRDGHLVSSGTIFPAPASPAHEVLGIWYVIIALVLGSLTILLTSFLIRTSLRISQRWQSRLQLQRMA
jgi:uncharacterized membrane protein